MQSDGGLDFGGPAGIELELLRPETLRRHLSVGLPLTNPKTLPGLSLGRITSNTTPRVAARYSTLLALPVCRLTNTRSPTSGTAYLSAVQQRVITTAAFVHYVINWRAAWRGTDSRYGSVGWSVGAYQV